MKRPVETDYSSHVAYSRALEEYCNALESKTDEPIAYCTLEQLALLRHMVPTSDRVPLYTHPYRARHQGEKP